MIQRFSLRLTHNRTNPSFGEFVALMAMMMSLVALSTDAMLPALPEIGRELGVHRANDNQLIISMLFVGLAVGQMIYGPLSDRTGRKPAIYGGFGLFITGCLLCLLAPSFPVITPSFPTGPWPDRKTRSPLRTAGT